MSKIRRRIAVVDDDASVRKALQRVLNSAGMDVDLFPSGRDFLCALPLAPPDCLVLDVHMPEVNGFDVQQRLVQLGVRLPMIMITGSDTGDVSETGDLRARAIEGGADLYLLKPLDDRLLLEGISYAMSMHLARPSHPSS